MSKWENTSNFGWIRDLPDIRDFTPRHKQMVPLLKRIKSPTGLMGSGLPPSADISGNASPIENQGDIGSCTANALAGIVEYMENTAYGAFTPSSRLFFYKVARELQGLTGDSGSTLRGEMGGLTLFGAPPEKYWPYTDQTGWDNEPTAFVYSLAQDYKAAKYYRLDPAGIVPADLLTAIKTQIVGKIPAIFGFTVYSSYTQAGTSGEIPFPAPSESVVGGHGVGAFGYDDSLQITNKINNATTKGAIKIRNSWGTSWGQGGYGWLPYDYILKGLATDWWSLLSEDYVATGQFGF